jgi:anthranilate synthase component 1
MERAGFEAMVETALEHIRAGDIFQVVLSQRFARATTAAPFDIFRALRVIHPSPYLFFLGGVPRVVLGASPEPLVRLQEG